MWNRGIPTIKMIYYNFTNSFFFNYVQVKSMFPVIYMYTINKDFEPFFFLFIYIYIYIYVWKLNQTVLELDFRAVKFLFFPRRDLNPHHCLYIYLFMFLYFRLYIKQHARSSLSSMIWYCAEPYINPSS
jgi:hypothetical protein